jgi:hypothetical protein
LVAAVETKPGISTSVKKGIAEKAGKEYNLYYNDRSKGTSLQHHQQQGASNCPD